MTNYFFVSLSFEPASSVWGNNALLSFSEAHAVIHLNNSKSLFHQVQSAARKLDGMSLQGIQLQGNNWDCELRWAFSQGLFNAKQGAKLHIGDIDEKQLQTLSSRKLIVEWVRNTINLGPEALSPVMLCDKAVTLIKHAVPETDFINYQIISGEALLEHDFQGIFKRGGYVHQNDLLRKSPYSASKES